MPTIKFYRLKFYDYRMGWIIEETDDPFQAQEMKAYRESQGFKVMMQEIERKTIHNA